MINLYKTQIKVNKHAQLTLCLQINKEIILSQIKGLSFLNIAGNLKNDQPQIKRIIKKLRL